MSLRSSKEKETYLLWTYHEETRQPGERYYNWDSTRKTGKRQAEDIMDEQHYCMDWANVKCYIEEDRGIEVNGELSVIWRAVNRLIKED